MRYELYLSKKLLMKTLKKFAGLHCPKLSFEKYVNYSSYCCLEQYYFSLPMLG